MIHPTGKTAAAQGMPRRATFVIPPRRSDFFARSYSRFALFASLNMVVLLGLGLYLVSSGWLSRSKVQGFLAALQGVQAAAVLPVAAPALAPAPQIHGESSAAAIQTVLESQELAQLQTDRLRVDLQHERGLLDRRMLGLQHEIEEFEQRSASHESQLAADRERQLSESFQQTVQTVCGLKPRNAVEILMVRPQAEAVQILLDMPARKRQQIVDACRGGEQTRWRDAMFEAMLGLAAQPGPGAGSVGSEPAAAD